MKPCITLSLLAFGITTLAACGTEGPLPEPTDHLRPAYADGSDIRGTRDVVNPSIQGYILTQLNNTTDHEALVGYMSATHSFDISNAQFVAVTDTAARPYIGISYRHPTDGPEDVEAVLVALVPGDAENSKRYNYVEECDPDNRITIVYVDGGSLKKEQLQ